MTQDEAATAAELVSGTERPTPGAHRPNSGDWLVSIVTLVTGVAIVAYLTSYNNRTWIGDEYLVTNTTWLLFFPFLVIFGLLRERAGTFGFRPAENRASFHALLLYLFMLPFLVGASRFPMFQEYYPMYRPAAHDGSLLLRWELAYGFYMFCWEFFYRGFLTFGLARAFGPAAAVTLQTIGFGLMHYGKPTPEFLGSFVAGAALGVLALRGKSFYPCFAVHWAVSVTFDLLCIGAKPGGLF